ncbi:FkbM family methyltransferase [soil metagenome]
MKPNIYKTYNTIFFCLFIVTNPNLIWIYFFKKAYLPVYIQFEWLTKFNIGTIIDVGAHNGRVSQTLHILFPEAHIYAFEPNLLLHESIIKKISKKNLTLESLAISNLNSKKIIYIANNSALSSIMQLLIPNRIENIKVIRKKKTIKTTTLDSYFEGKKLQKKILLKIDTEGAEGLVLEGGKKFLKNVSIVHIETYHTKIYKNQALFNEVYDFLISLGFTYKGNINEAYFYPKFELSSITNSVFIKK